MFQLVGNSTAQEGDLITIDGVRFMVVKKAPNMVKVTRYYWFDSVLDNIRRKLGH